MEEQVWIPNSLKRYTSQGEMIEITKHHFSGDRVFQIGDKYILKISKDGERLKREKLANDFLTGKLPVSESETFEEHRNTFFYVKTCVKGTPLSYDENINDPIKVASLLAEAMKMVHSVDTKECTIKNNYSEGNCFVHGDFCLPNILVANGHVTGFIDTEGAGLGDPWADYAWCIWSYEYNLKTTEYTPILLEKLGIEFDKEKFDRYTNLDD